MATIGWYLGSTLMVAVTNSLLGILVYFRGPNNLTNKLFSLFSFGIVVWDLGDLFSLMSPPVPLAIIPLTWRISYVGAIFIPALYVHFVFSLSEIKDKRIILYLAYAFSAILLFFNFFSSFFISGVTLDRALGVPRLISNTGPLFIVYMFFFIWGLVYGFYELARAYRGKDSFKKNQIKYVMLASLAALTAGSIYFLTIFGIEVPAIDNFIVTGYTLIVAYAIVTTRLLDIEVVIKKTAIYSLLTAILTGIFVSLIFLSQYFFSGLMGRSSLWAGITGAFIIALIFQPLRDGVQGLVDNFFFRARYNYQAILNKYSHSLARPMKDLDRFAKLAPYLLWKSMRLKSAAFIVLDRESKQYVVRAGNGEAEAVLGKTFAADSAIIQELIANYKEINREEIDQTIKHHPDLTDPGRLRLQKALLELDELKADLVIPSISESEYFSQPTLLAALVLGRKMSDESFSKQDIDFLETLANQSSISIEYAFILEELKRNQAQIVRTEKLAALGTTTAGIAHELKNPLTYLLTVAQTMESAWDNPDFKKSVLKMLPSEVERMKLIIDGLSDFSKQHELHLEPTDLIPVLDKTLALLAFEIKRNNIVIIKHYPPDNRALALADKNRLVQVFMNIIGNGIQAIGPKGGDVSLTVRVESKEVRVSITDNGPGIPPAVLAKIFEPFFTTKESGTGLGLPITKRLIDEHHGSIYIDSHLGEGSTFTICLPAAA